MIHASRSDTTLDIPSKLSAKNQILSADRAGRAQEQDEGFSIPSGTASAKSRVASVLGDQNNGFPAALRNPLSLMLAEVHVCDDRIAQLAVIFHSNFGDQVQMIMFLKNVSIAGGLLLLAAHGAGPLSIDRRFRCNTNGRIAKTGADE